MKIKVKLQTLNPYITCFLCKGYLIDAITVTECLHTFCKSCLIKHLTKDNSESNVCPKCEVMIHRSHPLQHLRADRTLQDIIYKLVPNLQQREIQREKYFCRIRGIPYPKDPPKSLKDQQSDCPNVEKSRAEFHADEKVCVQLEAKDNAFEQLPRKFICCSSRTTVTHLKKLIAKKVFCDLGKYCAIDIMCKEEVLGKDHTLKFISVTRWRCEDPPLRLFYMPKLDLKEC